MAKKPTINQLLSKAIDESGLNAYQIRDAAGDMGKQISTTQIYNYAKGRQIPGFDKVQVLCKILGIDFKISDIG